MRNMSPQAYRRLRAVMTEGELRNLAEDINDALRHVGAMKSSYTQTIAHALMHASPYTRIAQGARVRVLDDAAGTQQEFRGIIASGDADGWMVRSLDGELAGPYQDKELERVDA